MTTDDIHERSQLGHRILHISQDPGVSDFFVTPWEQLVVRRNGKLIYDSYVYQPSVPLEAIPGTHDYAVSMGGRRYRVNRLATRGRLRWVLRLLPAEIPPIEKLAVPHAAIKAMLESKNGLFLVCGATGSGKSTTIASLMLERAKRRQEHVITFEDPIEFLFPQGLPSLVSQREIGSDEMDFGKSLRAALRQAPDVILVGEIRDGETAEIALQAAETGHLVVATLHTSSAAQTVQRFLKLVPSERLETAMMSFADSFRGILCQRLLLDDQKGKRFAIHELLLPYDSVCGIIRRGEFKKLEHELEAGLTRGMISFERSLQQKEYEGWRPAFNRPTGFAEHEVFDYLQKENLTATYAAA
ncbi:MAG: type IV pilus twitching motility protein PilT [Roseimicrobium sp.]